MHSFCVIPCPSYSSVCLQQRKNKCLSLMDAMVSCRFRLKFHTSIPFSVLRGVSVVDFKSKANNWKLHIHSLLTLKGAPPLFFLPPISPPFSAVPPFLLCPSLLSSVVFALFLCVWLRETEEERAGSWKLQVGGVASGSVITCPDGPVWPCINTLRHSHGMSLSVLNILVVKAICSQKHWHLSKEFVPRKQNSSRVTFYSLWEKDWICRRVIFKR